MAIALSQFMKPAGPIHMANPSLSAIASRSNQKKWPSFAKSSSCSLVASAKSHRKATQPRPCEAPLAPEHDLSHVAELEVRRAVLLQSSGMEKEPGDRT